MKKTLSILLTTGCVLALAGCEGVNIPGAYSQAPITQQAAEAQAESTVDAPETIAPPSDTAVSDLTAPDTTQQPQTGASAQAPQAPAQPAAPQQPAPQTQTGTGTATDIGEAKAREIALAHAQLKESDVTFIKSHPDYDDGRYVYDVEFYKDMTEYDYEIDAYSGAILSFDFDVEDYAIAVPQQQPKAPAQPAPAPAQQPAAGNITLDQAKAAALQRAGVSGATFTKAHLDYDDGIAVYEIEFIAGAMEYDVEVDARTGAIREFDAESVYDD